MNWPWKPSKLQLIQDNLLKLSIARATLERSGPSSEATLLDALQLVTLLIYDCFVVLDDLKRAEDGYRQTLYFRLFSVLAVDAIERCQNLLGLSGAELAEIASTMHLGKPLAKSKKELEGIRRKHEKFLRDVRNTLIAHTTFDTAERIRRLEDLDREHMMTATKDILRWIDSLQLDLDQLLKASALKVK